MKFNPLQPELNKNSIRILRYLLSSYYNAHGELLGDQYKLLIIPMKDVPSLSLETDSMATVHNFMYGVFSRRTRSN